MKEKFKRGSRWFLFNGIFAVSIYFGFFQEINGFLNIALFIGWLTSICAILISFDAVGKGVGEKLAKESKDFKPVLFSPLKELDLLFDLIVVFIFAYFGHFVLATFYFIHILALINFKDTVQKTINEYKEGS